MDHSTVKYVLKDYFGVSDINAEDFPVYLSQKEGIWESKDGHGLQQRNSQPIRSNKGHKQSSHDVYSDGRDLSEAIIAAIKFSPEQVRLCQAALTDCIDNSYLSELALLPDYNTLSGFKRGVLMTLWSYVRRRLFPTSRRYLNHSSLDMLFLELLHSTLLKGLISHSIPRVLLRWIRAFAQEDRDSILRLMSLRQQTLDAISSGDIDTLRTALEEGCKLVPGFALQQVADLGGWTLMHFAASVPTLSAESFQMILVVLQANHLSINCLDYHQATPLHIAARHCSLNAISTLAAIPYCIKSHRDRASHIPLHHLIRALSKVSISGEGQSGSSNRYLKAFAAVRDLLPNGDVTYIFQSCSHHKMRSALSLILCQPDRDLGHAVMNLLNTSVTSSNSLECYPVLLEALVLCIRHHRNSFFSQLVDLIQACQSIYQPHQPLRLHWEVFNIFVSVGILYNNTTAAYWALDHLVKALEFRLAHAQRHELSAIGMRAAYPIPLKLSVYLAVLRNEDRILALLLKKLPIQFVYPLLSQRDRLLRPVDEDTGSNIASAPPSSSSSIDIPSFRSFIREHLSFLGKEDLWRWVDEFSLFNLACLHGHTACVSVILKQLFINQGHMDEALVFSIHAQGVLLACLGGHLATVQQIRDSLGPQRFASVIYSRWAEDLTSWSILETFVVYLRHSLDKSIPHSGYSSSQHYSLGDSVNSLRNRLLVNFYQPIPTYSSLFAMLQLLLQHLPQRSSVTALPGYDGCGASGVEDATMREVLTSRLEENRRIVKNNLLYSLLPTGQKWPVTVLIGFLANTNEEIVDLMTDWRDIQQRWQAFERDLIVDNLVFKAGIR